jgi:hypothetical protein
VRYCYDATLSPEIGRTLRHVGYPIEFPEKDELDEVLVPRMGREGLTWITKDDRARTQHEDEILAARISIVWIRGLAHDKGKRSPLTRNNITLKQVLRMLVDKLDDITARIANANRPCYFVLYMSNKGRAEHEEFASLREVSERLSGTRK